MGERTEEAEVRHSEASRASAQICSHDRVWMRCPYSFARLLSDRHCYSFSPRRTFKIFVIALVFVERLYFPSTTRLAVFRNAVLFHSRTSRAKKIHSKKYLTNTFVNIQRCLLPKTLHLSILFIDRGQRFLLIDIQRISILVAVVVL